MRVGRGVDKLRGDADLVTRPAGAPFQHIAHAQFAANLLRVDRLILIGERSVAGDHKHVRDPREISRQILGDTVGEILLLRIVAEIGKRQHYN